MTDESKTDEQFLRDLLKKKDKEIEALVKQISDLNKESMLIRDRIALGLFTQMAGNEFFQELDPGELAEHAYKLADGFTTYRYGMTMVDTNIMKLIEENPDDQKLGTKIRKIYGDKQTSND